jgi:hypothetical protein
MNEIQYRWMLLKIGVLLLLDDIKEKFIAISKRA